MVVAVLQASHRSRAFTEQEGKLHLSRVCWDEVTTSSAASAPINQSGSTVGFSNTWGQACTNTSWIPLEVTSRMTVRGDSASECIYKGQGKVWRNIYNERPVKFRNEF